MYEFESITTISNMPLHEINVGVLLLCKYYVIFVF
jgi:hypothetical protein